MFDREILREILINLIQNSIKYTYEGEIVVKMSRENIDNYIKIEVIDTGIGLQLDE